MKTMMLTLAAATALTAGAATAQPYGWGRADSRWMPIDARQEQIAFRIDQGVRSGQLTSSEAYRLRTEFNRIARLEARYRINGLSNWERADLDRRLDMLTSDVRMARRDDDRRYGYLDRDDFPPY
jgi:hypothetical protein